MLMRLTVPEKINRKAWLTRLGTPEDRSLDIRMSEAEHTLLDLSDPRGVYVYADIGEIDLPGEAIKKHLKGCGRMVLMAVTLGPGADTAIRKEAARDMAMSVFLDSGASVLAEQECDIMCEEIQKSLPRETPFMTGRYSPGYGDLPLETQDILAVKLDAAKKIGLTVTASHLMIPRKSVTAVMGIADHPVSGYLAVCSECALKDTCELRKAGRVCG